MTLCNSPKIKWNSNETKGSEDQQLVAQKQNYKKHH